MEFRILGQVEARRDGTDLRVGGPKLRALLAILLLRCNEVVSRDRLIEGLWGDRPPASAGHTLDDNVSRLRKALGEDRIARRPPGYRLRVEAGELDLSCFEALFRAGREALAAGDAEHAEELLGEALALWRGPALADVLYEPFAQAEAERLEERRLLAVEERMEATIALGSAADRIAELERLVQEHPLRERLVAQLMLALYTGGRQAEALAVCECARRRLAEELGLEPGPLLRAQQQKILNQDPSLAPPAHSLPSRPVPRKRGRRKLAIAAGAATAIVALSAAVATLFVGDTKAPAAHTLAASRLSVLSLQSGAREHEVALHGAPAAMARDGQSLWLADPDAGTTSRVDLSSGEVVDRIPLGGNPGAVVTGGGSVWVTGLPGATVTRIDADTGAVTQTVPLGNASAAALAFGAGGLWVANTTDNSLIQIDPGSGRQRRTLPLDLRPTALAIGAGSIWAASYDASAVVEVDPSSGGTLARIDVPKGPVALVVAYDALWVASALDSTVARIDPDTGVVVDIIPVGSGPVALAVGGGSVWAANQYSGTVAQIDPRRNVVVRKIRVGGLPTTLTAASGKLWVGVRPDVQRRGGTLVLLRSTPLSVDPAVESGVATLQNLGLTTDGLVTFNHAGGPRGLQLVPDLALSLPNPTDGGRTYTFRLRPGIRYSDGRLVRARDFRRQIARAFRLGSLDRDLLAGIVGAAACSAADAGTCDLSRGVATDDAARTVTFHLVGPDPHFLSNLTNGGVAVPVPPGTPMTHTSSQPIPGTGPYMVERADRHGVHYVRNPYFHEWSHAAQPAGNPDEIVWRFGLSPAREVREIQEGRADWMADAVPGALLPSLRTRFAGQLHSYPTTDTEFLQFNTTRAPFDDVRVRQALNLALDRRVVTAIWGGPETAEPTCQMLPPGVPGFHRYCPYTRAPGPSGTWTAPDLARAKHLVALSGTRGTGVTVTGWNDDPYAPPSMVEHVAAVLRSLGYRARVELVTHAALAHPPQRVFGSIQVIPTGWTGVTAWDFFATWLSCDGTGDHSWFCIPRIDREMREARSLEASRPRAAALLWQKIDREIVDRAALVPLVNPRQIEFSSKRVRNFQHHSYLNLIADQVWLT